MASAEWGMEAQGARATERDCSPGAPLPMERQQNVMVPSKPAQSRHLQQVNCLGQPGTAWDSQGQWELWTCNAETCLLIICGDEFWNKAKSALIIV